MTQQVIGSKLSLLIKMLIPSTLQWVEGIGRLKNPSPDGHSIGGIPGLVEWHTSKAYDGHSRQVTMYNTYEH